MAVSFFVVYAYETADMLTCEAYINRPLARYLLYKRAGCNCWSALFDRVVI